GGSFQKIVAWLAIQERGNSNRLLMLRGNLFLFCRRGCLVRGRLVLRRRSPNNNQSLFLVGNIEKAVHWRNKAAFSLLVLLLVVFWENLARGINRSGAGSSYSPGIFCVHIELLPQPRDGSGDHALGKIFVLDVGYVVDSQAALAHGGVE